MSLQLELIQVAHIISEDLEVIKGNSELRSQRDLNGWLWSISMAWFTLRFVVLYVLYLPFIMACNIAITAKSHPKVSGLDDILFWIFIGSSIIATTLWFSTICLYQAYIHFMAICHSILICYFVSDKTYAPNILLAALALYLSTSYDLINDDITLKNYHILCTWLFQLGTKSPSHRWVLEESSHTYCSWFGSILSWAWKWIWRCGQ